MTAKKTEKPTCSLCRRLLCNTGSDVHLRVIFIPVNRKLEQLPDHNAVEKIVCNVCGRGMVRDVPSFQGGK